MNKKFLAQLLAIALMMPCFSVYAGKNAQASPAVPTGVESFSDARLWELNLGIVGGFATFLANHAELNNVDFAPVCTGIAKAINLVQSSLAFYNNKLESCVEHSLLIGLDLKDEVLAIKDYKESCQDEADDKIIEKVIPTSQFEKVLIYDALPILESFSKVFKAFNGANFDRNKSREIAMSLAVVCRLSTEYLKGRTTENGKYWLAFLASYIAYAMQKIYRLEPNKLPKDTDATPSAAELKAAEELKAAKEAEDAKKAADELKTAEDAKKVEDAKKADETAKKAADKAAKDAAELKATEDAKKATDLKAAKDAEGAKNKRSAAGARNRKGTTRERRVADTDDAEDSVVEKAAKQAVKEAKKAVQAAQAEARRAKAAELKAARDAKKAENKAEDKHAAVDIEQSAPEAEPEQPAVRQSNRLKKLPARIVEPDQVAPQDASEEAKARQNKVDMLRLQAAYFIGEDKDHAAAIGAVKVPEEKWPKPKWKQDTR